MPDVLFNNGAREIARGGVEGKVFHAMLLGASYVPNKDTHTTRANLTGEIAAGGGYASGGKAIPVSVLAVDAANDRYDIRIGPLDFNSLTVTGVAWVVIYCRVNGTINTDWLLIALDVAPVFNLTAETLTIEPVLLRNVVG